MTCQFNKIVNKRFYINIQNIKLEHWSQFSDSFIDEIVALREETPVTKERCPAQDWWLVLLQDFASQECWEDRGESCERSADYESVPGRESLIVHIEA